MTTARKSTSERYKQRRDENMQQARNWAMLRDKLIVPPNSTSHYMASEEARISVRWARYANHKALAARRVEREQVSMTIASDEDLERAYDGAHDEYINAHRKGKGNADAAHLWGLCAVYTFAAVAVRDAVLEGLAQEAEDSMIGYGASDDEGDAVAAWLRSRKGDQ